MICLWNHDIARQRQQELLAAAERYRLARIARDKHAADEFAVRGRPSTRPSGLRPIRMSGTRSS